MSATMTAEWLKLRKRPAAWVLPAVLVVTVALFGYVFAYLFISGAGGDQGEFDAAALLPTLLPANLVTQAIGLCTNPGGPIALILGALAVGSEYSWGTVKTMAMQRPRRITLMGGKLVVLAGLTLLYALLVLATAAAASVVVASLEGADTAFPSIADLANGLASAWLVLAVWAGFGAVLAVLFRGTGFAIGVGLVYSLVVESLITFLPFSGPAMRGVRQSLLSTNASALSTQFGELAEGFGPTALELPSAGQAAIVLGVYVLVFAAAALAIFHRRQLT
ncbi:MAG: ABC transporter permease [Egibacteraceae bacterium]